MPLFVFVPKLMNANLTHDITGSIIDYVKN